MHNNLLFHLFRVNYHKFLTWKHQILTVTTAIIAKGEYVKRLEGGGGVVVGEGRYNICKVVFFFLLN